ncbi:MAG: hypothetical protein LBE12_04835 [Planctomycetaceae bacterium]|nr:hypothetical protein [Planctomycetaceae bacterium]
MQNRRSNETQPPEQEFSTHKALQFTIIPAKIRLRRTINSPLSTLRYQLKKALFSRGIQFVGCCLLLMLVALCWGKCYLIRMGFHLR